MFDVDEYIHLALHASSVGNHHACMSYLKEALEQQPKHAVATYLLAVQHAELGLFERGINGMKAAITLDPQLDIARFQLGLLLLDRYRPSEAQEHFAALGRSANPELRVYSEAMHALTSNDLGAAKEKLALGLSGPSGNPALAALMQRVLDKLSKDDEAPADKPVVQQPEPQDSQVVLSAYMHAVS